MGLLNTISVDITNKNNIINYPILGDILLEIQGDLEIERPNETDLSKEYRFGELEFSLHINEDQIKQVIKELNIKRESITLETLSRVSSNLQDAICKSNDKKECVVYIGTKQRLIGKFLKLPLPMMILEMEGQEKITAKKVIKYKFQFVDRPLPIM
ncbi:hypothetical protein QEN19_002590 [Hanseniaspora menglaensis]